MNVLLQEFLDRLHGADTAEAAAWAFVELGQRIGAVSVRTFFGQKQEDQFVSTLPLEWWAAQSRQSSFDRAHGAMAVRQGVPVVLCGLEVDAVNPLSTAEGKLVAQAYYESAGARSVVVFSMPAFEGGGWGAGMAVGFPDKLGSFNRRQRATFGALGTAATASYATMCRLRKAEAKAASPLSRREDQVLRYIGDGLQTAAIADRLDLSESAVNLYLARLRKKLNARTREHALAVALMNGWIE